MVQRWHSMPFGAAVSEAGVRFRLWAPAARRIDVKLLEQRRILPMPAREGGWFELAVPGLGNGALYQFIIDGGQVVPDPASRFQPADVHGPSQAIDPAAFDWDDGDWIGRPWHEAVIYELHIGAFTEEGTFAAAVTELERLARLGVTAIELMPVADFSGARNWGYDGVLPFAPDSRYGHCDDLKRLVCAAHRMGLMVFIDVVYNHFGPEGNFLHLYSPQFFSEVETAWGKSLNFSRGNARTVRDYFIDNALYWVKEFNVDGLRFDAVHAIADGSEPHLLTELASRLRNHVPPTRHVHLVLENDNNEARWLARDAQGRARLYDAQWNDDFHHALHVILTGEIDGYYEDYAASPIESLCRSLTQGFSHPGEWSKHRGRNRGEASAHLPPTAFVNFLQNHDQIGNRALGQRLSELVPAAPLAAATAILLLAPSPPLLFMGEEWGARTPFLFFCDFKGELGSAVREGRRREFAKFPAFAEAEARMAIPDPVDAATYEQSRLDRSSGALQADIAELYWRLLDIRRREIMPRLAGAPGSAARYRVEGRAFSAEWRLGDGSALRLAANLSQDACALEPLPAGWRLIYGSGSGGQETLRPWSIAWSLRAPAPA